MTTKYQPPTEIYDVILNPKTATGLVDVENDFERHFKRMQHFSYILGVDGEHMQQQLYFHVTDYLKMSAVYWGMMALYLAGGKHLMNREGILDFVIKCYDKEGTGGFRGNINHDVHLLYTLSAIQILAMFDKLDIVDQPKLYQYLASLQRPDGSFVGDVWGEVDTRFSYCAMLIVAILNEIPPIDAILEYHTDTYLHFDQLVAPQSPEAATKPLPPGVDSHEEKTAMIRAQNKKKIEHNYPLMKQINFYNAIDYVLQCRSFDGGFGAVVGGESHSGQIFCSLATLCLLKVIPYAVQKEEEDQQQQQDNITNINLTQDDPQAKVLGWWLCERQLSNGGLNGRPEKKEDVCYSWWVLTGLKMLNKINWINKSKLTNFIMSCQDEVYGGISDRSDTMTDIYHTYFGIAGLCLLGQPGLESVEPVYALPLEVVLRVNARPKSGKK